VAALTDSGYPYHLVDVSGADDAYFLLLAGLWNARADFLLVEHDMVPTAEMFTAMEECPRWWCVNPYGANEWGTNVETGFGFTRFRRELMDHWPDIWDGVGRWYTDDTPPRHFGRLDTRFFLTINRRKDPYTDMAWFSHSHALEVAHLHDYASGG
jgi:hypothetical protein